MKFNLDQLREASGDLNLPEKPSEKLAEETGLHIGDGSMNFYENGHKLRGLYSLRGHRLDDREHYDRIIKKLYYELYNLRVSLKDMPKEGVYGFQKWSDKLVRFKHEILGLQMGKKLNINIPEIFTSKEKFVTNAIKGIFDTDGMIYLEPKRGRLYPRIEISTISPKLGLQLNELINKLSMRSTVYVCKRTNLNWHDAYKISVRGDEMLNKWMERISPNNIKHWKKFQFYIDNS